MGLLRACGFVKATPRPVDHLPSAIGVLKGSWRPVNHPQFRDCVKSTLHGMPHPNGTHYATFVPCHCAARPHPSMFYLLVLPSDLSCAASCLSLTY